MLELFRTLSSFKPARVDLTTAPWDAYVPWAIGQGLAPLAAYNLEYQLGQCGAPQWARDRLLSIYQGSANDNVMKLVNFKRSVEKLQGRKVLLIGSASFVESLYPHVAFRPVIDFRLAVAPFELDPFTKFLSGAEFKPDEATTDTTRPDRILSDTRSLIFLHGHLSSTPKLDSQLFDRSVPMKVYGPSMRRLDLEDAILVHVLLMARAGFEIPMIEFVDLRELVLGAPDMGGIYSRAIDLQALRTRVKEWNMERALWSALSILERLYPQTSSAVAELKPDLSFPIRELLERAVVIPTCELGRTRAFRGEDALRALLAGG